MYDYFVFLLYGIIHDNTIAFCVFKQFEMIKEQKKLFHIFIIIQFKILKSILTSVRQF